MHEIKGLALILYSFFFLSFQNVQNGWLLFFILQTTALIASLALMLLLSVYQPTVKQDIMPNPNLLFS